MSMQLLANHSRVSLAVWPQELSSRNRGFPTLSAICYMTEGRCLSNKAM